MNPRSKYHNFCLSILFYLIEFYVKIKFYFCSEEETDYLKIKKPGWDATNISWYDHVGLQARSNSSCQPGIQASEPVGARIPHQELGLIRTMSLQKNRISTIQTAPQRNNFRKSHHTRTAKYRTNRSANQVVRGSLLSPTSLCYLIWRKCDHRS